MKASLTVADVLHDVEIELMQSAVTHNELGQSVGAVRGHMNRLRSELLDHARLPGDDRKVAAAQFELTDMVLTLLEETAIRLQAIQWEQQRLLRRLVPGPEALAAQAGSARQPVVAGGAAAPRPIPRILRGARRPSARHMPFATPLCHRRTTRGRAGRPHCRSCWARSACVFRSTCRRRGRRSWGLRW